ncbi:glycosyltransferase family 4 protein [uncultured Paraglaciecola sp.]|uniref:glycosyltransferase family 4 protein n=1 Tax=uncultured Paraglaciecola sp. TaxID=1765024 RepID=UPI0026218916|nr:glycosyltransferase family 4 protein [uncultured Paraglaciecola sp.]
MSNFLNNLNVALVGPIPPPAGGMANQTRKLRQFLQQENCTCQMVATNAPYRPAWAEKLPGVRAIFRLFPYLFALHRACKSADIMHIMANSGWSWHLFAAPAILIARWNKVPVMVNYRGGYAEAFFQQSWFWVNKTLSKAQGVIVPSPFLQDVFAKWQVDAGVVPNVLDTQLFCFQPKSKISDTPHIMVARNLEEIYDVPTAIHAFAIILQQFPDAQLSIAGSGPELDKLQQLTQQLGLTEKVTFTGRLTVEEMAKLYHSADLSINPSVVDNTPNSVIESLACGTPVVTTNVGGIPKLVSDQHDALLIDPAQPQIMADAAIKILSDNDLRQRLIDNGQQTTEKFHWQNVKQLLSQYYQAAINGDGK